MFEGAAVAILRLTGVVGVVFRDQKSDNFLKSWRIHRPPISRRGNKKEKRRKERTRNYRQDTFLPLSPLSPRRFFVHRTTTPVPNSPAEVYLGTGSYRVGRRDFAAENSETRCCVNR